MKILSEPLIFSSIEQNSSHQQRLKLIRSQGSDVSDSYKNFGKDYYDNPDVLQGFGGYHYDGRYQSCAEQLCKSLDFETILDFGCAKGFLLYEFLKQSKNITGIDHSVYALSHAKDEVKPFLYRSITDVSLASLNNLEVVLTRDVFPHLDYESVCSLLEYFQDHCPDLKLFYIEILVGNDKSSSAMLKDWDPTHKLIHGIQWWNKLFEQFDLPYNIYYKDLFNN